MFTEQAWAMIARSLKLSPRELQILRGVFDDRTELAIAAVLGISPHTAHTYIERLHHKLAVADRVEPVVRVMGAVTQGEEAVLLWAGVGLAMTGEAGDSLSELPAPQRLAGAGHGKLSLISRFGNKLSMRSLKEDSSRKGCDVCCRGASAKFRFVGKSAASDYEIAQFSTASQRVDDPVSFLL
jgi:DNA-binding CsgD family transcriptional regulator